MHTDDRLLGPNAAIHQPGHDLVALRVESAIGTWLRHAIGQLAVAQIPIWRHGNAQRPLEPRF
jgi:hypothetical protein